MNKTTNKLRAKFSPETRFELRPTPPAPFRATQEDEFERLKNRLLTETLLATAQPELNVAIRRAANEAAALANYLRVTWGGQKDDVTPAMVRALR